MCMLKVVFRATRERKIGLISPRLPTKTMKLDDQSEIYEIAFQSWNVPTLQTMSLKHVRKYHILVKNRERVNNQRLSPRTSPARQTTRRPLQHVRKEETKHENMEMRSKNLQSTYEKFSRCRHTISHRSENVSCSLKDRCFKICVYIFSWPCWALKNESWTCVLLDEIAILLL